MPLYEYDCPEHGRFEALRGMEIKTEPCPLCGKSSKRLISRFGWKWYNFMTADGEGFTTRWTSHDEIKEMRRGAFLGQS